jgi:SAM-dependent methyltransferase
MTRTVIRARRLATDLENRIRSKLGLPFRYRPQPYWEARAAELIETYDEPASWPSKHWLRAGIEEEVVPRLLRDAGVQSVLVIGSGTGRQYEFLLPLGFDLAGFDLSPALVAECIRRYPTVPTAVGDVIGAEKRHAQADAVVSSAVLAHVPPEGIATAVASVTRLARRMVIVREYTRLGRAYAHQWAHDYDSLFAGWTESYRQVTDEWNGHRAQLIAWTRGV